MQALWNGGAWLGTEKEYIVTFANGEVVTVTALYNPERIAAKQTGQKQLDVVSCKVKPRLLKWYEFEE